MTQFFTSSTSLAIGFIVLAIAVLVLVVLILRPNVREVPMSRRRPGVAPKPSMLSRFAESASRGVDKVISSRGGGMAGRLELAGVRMRPGEFLVLVLCGVIVGLAVGLLTGNFFIMLVLGLVPVVVAWLALTMMTDRRQAAFASQLEETAQMLAGSLRTGYSLGQAMGVVAKEADSPTNEEFARITNQLRLGRPVGIAMEETAARMKSDDFFWIAQAVAINREVGGNLAEVLDGVATTIRERAELRRHVAALSAEGRLSAIILMALPFAVGGLLTIVNPTYILRLFDNALGMVMFGGACLLLLIGGLWLRTMVKLKY